MKKPLSTRARQSSTLEPRRLAVATGGTTPSGMATCTAVFNVEAFDPAGIVLQHK